MNLFFLKKTTMLSLKSYSLIYTVIDYIFSITEIKSCHAEKAAGKYSVFSFRKSSLIDGNYFDLLP